MADGSDLPSFIHFDSKLGVLTAETESNYDIGEHQVQIIALVNPTLSTAITTTVIVEPCKVLSFTQSSNDHISNMIELALLDPTEHFVALPSFVQ